MSKKKIIGIVVAALTVLSFLFERTLVEEKFEKQIVTIINQETLEFDGKSYDILEVDGGDRSGERISNVAVNIGFGERDYWGLTNENGQLVYVFADQIILQNDDTEPVNKKGRYYNDEARVPGTEMKDFDQGHVIADSLGGVSNAYNITPQDSILNRHGDQAYMEKVIRDAGGCKRFFAIITYPNTSTQTPSSYRFEYILKGKKIVDDFENVNPDKINQKTNSFKNENLDKKDFDEEAELLKIDTNGNGKVTIKEAEDAGYLMPVYSTHWLYKYMNDSDGDGKIGK